MVHGPHHSKQSLQNLKGEIEFRAKLARQHVTGEILLPNYYPKDEHDGILFDRVKATSEKMTALARLGVQFSPFLELGAERGQRSLVLVNDFHASGVAADISYHQLGTMEHFSKLFKKPNLPLRICCDANHLPFRNGSFPFVFCYGFLHHFPALEPVIREIYRVLGNGYFYFDEEPFKRILKLRLYKQRDSIYARSTLEKSRFRRFLESFISESSSDEVDHGIVENENIGLGEWTRALAVFHDRDVDLVSVGNVTSKLGDHLRFGNIPNVLLGGGISGLCRKADLVGKRHEPARLDPYELLACPECVSASTADGLESSALVRAVEGFRCSRCGATYPERDGILFLLPRKELRELYPGLMTSGGGL